MHDLVIENARVYDGTGAPPIEGAVAVTGDKIAAVGKDVGPGENVVDAEGLSLAPGIIDSHTHYDAQLTWDPYAIPSPLLGVSTVIIGNCGFTIAPCHPEDRDLTMRHLEKVEAMPIDALRAGTRWDFETFEEYLDMLERGGTVPNVAAYCGHSALRTWVMRAASDEEVAEMKAVLRGALDAGAIGFSTSTFSGHNGADGVPMPSRLADEREMRALAATLGEAGKGIMIASAAVVRAHPPPCRPSLPLAGFRLVCAHHRQGFPCCSHPPLPCVLPPLPRWDRSVPASFASQPMAAFPGERAGRLPRR